MHRLLVVDDEPNIIYTIRETLSSPRLRVLSAGTAAEGLAAFEAERPDAVLLDIRLPDMSGLDAFDRIHASDPRVPVILMTAFARTETAIDAMSRGAFEYLVKPVDLGRLKQTIARAFEVSALSRRPALIDPEDDRSPSADADPDADADRIVGNSLPMQEVYKAVGRVAPQDAAVLILGESGTGKELVARAIYHYSRRRARPFLAINCAALPETLLESELFGHERGAFTGADQRRIGKFEQVNGGTIFLDEIGDMSPATQAKALRLLQEQQFERLGGNTAVRTDVRIIAATNKDLAQLVSAGAFRQDLFYRLNGYTIRLPPLRDRKEDLPALIEHFIRRVNREAGKDVRIVSEEALAALLAHDWPGNVRELASAIRYAVVNAPGGAITPDCLPPDCLPPAGTSVPSTAAGAPALDLSRRFRALIADGQGDVYRRLLAEFDAAVVRLALDHTHDNQSQ
ncbi:MAG: sigma-54 dependent transcriptional regulator, partial [Thermoleophilia bacterium]|nr:sigma-54 dependent transcriptional regulator [Thermoleophilia bacterium]